MVDVTVRGAGITGLMCAWMLVRRGARVQIVDPNGVASGASGGVVGALAPHTPENWNAKKALQFKALDEAEALWAEVARISGMDPGYARTGRIQPLSSPSDVSLARRRSDSAARLWMGRYQWQVLSADQAGLRIESPTGLVIHDNLSARIHPRRACMALARALEELNVPVLSDAPAGGLEVWATGIADLAEISQYVGKAIGAPIKGQAAELAADLRDAPQVFANGLHIVPHESGTVAVGSTTERDFDEAAGTDERLEPLIDAARAAVPELARAPVVRRWAGLRPRTRSRAPMVGHHPSRAGAFIANGGFKIGFAMAPVMADLLAELVIDGRNGIPEDFRPEASF